MTRSYTDPRLRLTDRICRMGLQDWMFGGSGKRLARALAAVEAGFDSPPLGRPVIRRYRRALRLALRANPREAVGLVRRYNARIPADRYHEAFRTGDACWLAAHVADGDQYAFAAVLELATTLGLPGLQHHARDRMSAVLGRSADVNEVIGQLRRWSQLQLLDRDTATRVLRAWLDRTPLERDDRVWQAFFGELPESQMPDLFEVRCFVGRGADAVRLADGSVSRLRAAVDVCARSSSVIDVDAGLAAARHQRWSVEVRNLLVRRGDLLVADRLFNEALLSYQEAGRTDRVSECHEWRGRYGIAFDTCPLHLTDRLIRLAARCQNDVHDLADRGDFVGAMNRVRAVLDRLDLAAHSADVLERAGATDVVARCQAAVAEQRDEILHAGRFHFGATTPVAHAAWSRFEEAAGDLVMAAQQAEAAQESLRAARLYRACGQFGRAERIHQNDTSVEALRDRAETRRAAGDALGAAQILQETADLDAAIDLYMQAREFGAAMACLHLLHTDGVIEDPRTVACLRGAGDYPELVALCLRSLAAGSRPAREELRLLRADPMVPAALQQDIDAALDDLEAGKREAFERLAPGWVAKAREEIDRRFAGIWGLDLGTSTCAVAVFDTATGRAVLCPTETGEHLFASTLSLDVHGDELVGLAGERLLTTRLVGHIAAAKRAMGTSRRFSIADREYRPEEVAARLIAHGRTVVERFLADRVADLVAASARAEFGVVPDELLARAAREHDMRLSRPRVLVTVPAYFTNNQTAATRAACSIADVEPVLLLREPTAACVVASLQHHLNGAVVVIDLGAGTLDASYVEVSDGVHRVRQVQGDTRFGSIDFDHAIVEELVARLGRQGIQAPASGPARQRLEVAAEHLKITLSSVSEAEYVLVGFADERNVTLTLSRTDLASVLTAPLGRLHRLCTRFRDELPRSPHHLVLVGGPMRSPLVRELVEKVFGLSATGIQDPRTAVACGAALQSAVIDGKLRQRLIHDVTSLSLGIQAADENGVVGYSRIIEGNCPIPVTRSAMYTTHRDRATGVRIQVFNGAVDSGSLIGTFCLEGLPPAPRGVPKIEVTFSIDESGVLKVTAREIQTGIVASIKIIDSTLLAPSEVDALSRRHHELAVQQELRHAGDRLRRELRTLVATVVARDVDAAWQRFCERKAAHRPSARADAGTQQILIEVFRDANQTSIDLDLVRVPLRDLLTNAQQYLDRPAAAEDPAGDLATGQHLLHAVQRHLARLDPLLARIARWNATLAQLTMADPDPLRRFRDLHDTREFVRALDSLRTHGVPLTDAADITRHLRCLAETGDAEAYRRVLVANAAGLGLVLPDPDRPERFLDPLRDTLVRVDVARHPDRTGCCGVLVRNDLVLVPGGLTEHTTPADVEIVGGAGPGPLVPAGLLTSTGGGPAAIRLKAAAPIGPIRLGHPKLLRVGDRVWAVGGPGSAPFTAVPGFVNRFGPTCGSGPRTLAIEIPGPVTDGPLFNDLGELVGLRSGTSAVQVESLESFPGPA
ncbi:molecular chaperone DnaK [Actinoplanes sp. SE50]|uniref:Hsp70 family protein n=1 Tax=unclassified Actinoplanes TaxID=2626549 RepID=UPI00023ECE76|nr:MULTISPECIES: Hsp70 family protein [unclassified Actinoplanes]AEV84318.1 molecular chaperone DnaK [Actinoplanes sp. SE50/110]ATO82710.1 molecular chaperone DnaK [Actinoplanes sp. SE50]SLM00117.1 molecular chaperone DnaK [Actinoplanes sp. SE50/110]